MMYLYLIMQFLVIYFSVKVWGSKMIEKVEKSRYNNTWIEQREFWIIILVSLFWVIVIPSIIAWRFLDKLTNKFLTNNK